MFFRHKKKEERPPPVEEIRRMSSRGLSDRIIVKELKSRGYSYPEIEKAMLEAVKEGVEGTQPAAQLMFQQAPQPAMQPAYAESEQVGLEELFGPATPSAPEQQEDADALIEELIEGVIEDKWRKFEERARKLEDELASMRAEISQLSRQAQAPKEDTAAKEQGAHISEILSRVEDLEARIGGLEKAFKQFLPSLTHNIESLSEMIHEMKAKQGIVA